MNKVYIVIFYTNYRKENEWKIQAVFSEEEKAINYAENLSKNTHEDPYEEENVDTTEHTYVQPHEDQEVIFKKQCYYKTDPTCVYGTMSWTPYIAVVKINVQN